MDLSVIHSFRRIQAVIEISSYDKRIKQVDKKLNRAKDLDILNVNSIRCMTKALHCRTLMSY